MKYGIIDTHTHLYLREFSDDLSDVINRAQTGGVGRFLLPNIDETTIDDVLRLSALYPRICYPMVGLHPTELSVNPREQLNRLRQIVINDRSEDGKKQFIAIGEAGLDLYWDSSRIEDQKMVLNEQINWALEFNLPIVLHCRDAFPALFEILEPYKNSSLRGVFHCFSGTEENAHYLMQFKGFLFGIGGVVTYKRSLLPNLLTIIPLERVVVETDAPYLPPVPHRGERNEPLYLKHVVEKLSEIYDKSVEEITMATTQNAISLFGIE